MRDPAGIQNVADGVHEAREEARRAVIGSIETRLDPALAS